MREHEQDLESSAGRPRDRPGDHDVDPAVDPALRAGRPEPLAPTGLLHLQRAAGNAGVQRLVRGRSTEAEEPSPVHAVVREQGEPLDTGTRGLMEERLGHDFGDVRVHHDAGAAASAHSVQAHAYTVGSHVVFGEGRYQPDSDEGRRTIAHELTHVVQQRQGPVDGMPATGGINVSDPSDRFEREAEHTAAQAMAPQAPAPPAAPTAAPPVQRTVVGPGAEAQPVQRQSEDEEEPAVAPPGEAPVAEKEEEPTDEDTAVSRLAVQRQESEEDEPEETPA